MARVKKLTIDFETYYDKEYSLSKLTTEEYIRDERFEIIGVAVKEDDGETYWASGTHEEIAEFLAEFDWANSIMIAQNTAFDGAIMAWHFGLAAKLYVDTMCMSRAWSGVHVSASLAKQAERHLPNQVKGTEVVKALGKRRESFSEYQLSEYGDYCVNDVELTYALFLYYMQQGFPVSELPVIDLTLRMFIEPELELDLDRLETHKYDVIRRKEKLLEESGVTKEQLMSNDKFAKLLSSLGVEPPTKISPRTGKEAFAFAKTDQGFKDLLEHDDDQVQALAAARLGNKSTLEETRTERFISIANRGPLPVPIKYYGAHTGRWSGQDKINLQNLPSRGPNGKKLKNTIRAPKGYVVVEGDLSQIEARLIAWLAGQQDLVDAFARGDDVYKVMASKIYGVPAEEVTDSQRFIGKMTILGCIAEGTPVLCKRGWVPIEQVTENDKLWDGENWVCHQGLVPKGYKETLNLCGSWLTPDHKVLCGTEWVESELVVQNENTLSQALERGAANLPSQAMLWAREAGLKRSSSSATAGSQNTQSTSITSKRLSLHAAMSARKNPLTTLAKCIGGILKSSQTMTTALDCLTGYPAQLADATITTTNTTLTTGAEGYKCAKNGVTTERHFSNMLSRWRDGITQTLRWTGQTTTEGTNQKTSDLSRDTQTCSTDEKSVSCRKTLMTYDIAYAGPNNRFTIWSESGPLIVHNCGYGMGAVRFKEQIKAMGNVDIPLDESKMIVQTYRSSNSRIKRLWSEANTSLGYLCRGDALPFGKDGVLDVCAERSAIILPNGLPMYYTGLHVASQGEYGPEYAIKTRNGVEKIYGGKSVENVCQALAKLVIADQMLKIRKRYPVKLTVHDSVAAIVPEAEIEDGAYYIYNCLRYTPPWAEGLPLDCELGYHKYYGSCDKNAKQVTKMCKQRELEEAQYDD